MPSGLKYGMENTIDTSKIQKLADKAAVDIMVGYKDGMTHNISTHKDETGKDRDYNGKDVPNSDVIDMVELVRDLNFGTATIPARPFIEDGIRSKEKELKKALEQQVEKVLSGGQANWGKVGSMAVGAIKEFVYGDYYKTNAPNSPRTIEYKGSDKPLLDTAEMVNSLIYVVNGVENK